MHFHLLKNLVEANKQQMVDRESIKVMQVIQELNNILKHIEDLTKYIKQEIKRLSSANLQTFCKNLENSYNNFTEQVGNQQWNDLIQEMLSQVSEIIEKDSFETHFGQPYSHFMKQFSQTMTEIVKEMTVVTQVLDPKYPLSKLTVSHVLEDHSKLITTINICEKRNLLVSGSLDWTVKLWDLQDTTLLKTFKDTKPVDVIHLIELQYLKNNHIVSELKGHSYFVTRLIFSNDEIYLISGSWYSWDNILIASHSYLKEIKIWSFKNQKLLCTQEGHSKGTGIQFSNDQQVLISSGEDGKIKLWSLIANSMIQKVFLTADSRFIISYCFKDQLVKVMDSNTGEEVKMFKVQKQGEGDFAGLSITKKLNIITYGDDRKVIVWRMN